MLIHKTRGKGCVCTREELLNASTQWDDVTCSKCLKGRKPQMLHMASLSHMGRRTTAALCGRKRAKTHRWELVTCKVCLKAGVQHYTAAVQTLAQMRALQRKGGSRPSSAATLDRVAGHEAVQWPDEEYVLWLSARSRQAVAMRDLLRAFLDARTRESD